MGKKRSYKQNEVCRKLDIQPYVLRHWETEFPFLKTSRGSGAARTFSAAEVELLGRIRSLLYEDGYTMAGARKRIEAERAGTLEAPSAPSSKDATPPAAKAAEVAVAAPASGALRTGIAEALAQARAILARLDGG